ncbi:type II toxin-antitoxin system PemK/MazF family toxin [Ekhidna sp.]|uniref:type II toxin-antitoxin system PemK/MazF family toxin n=1 Tax=Ekhidna sp. TaxID=2608089 RepID=UPI003CCBB6E8
MEIDQYRVVLVNLDPTIGSEINKTRPCVIISPDEMNRNIRTITIAPMTTKSKDYPTRFKVRQNSKTGWIVLDQIRTIDKKRIVKSFKKLSEKEVLQVKRVIRETFVD